MFTKDGLRACDACVDPLRRGEWQIMWGVTTPAERPDSVDVVCDEHLPDTLRRGLRRLPPAGRFWLDTTRILTKEGS
jgi:hypothetical protein